MIDRRLRDLCGGLLLCATAAGFVPAAETQKPAAAPASSFTEYVEVDASGVPRSNTISTKLPLAPDQTPANVGVVGEALIREQAAQTLGDALWNISGLNVIAGSGVHDNFVVRGFDALSNGLVLSDGAVEPETTFYPTYNLQGVELLKGPAGFLFGANPLAGAINLVRKQPLPTDAGRLSFAVGSFATAEGRLDWNNADATGDRAFRLNAMWRESDGYRDGQDSRHVAVNPGFTWQLGPGARLNVNLEVVDADYTPDSGLPLVAGAAPDVPRRRSYQSPYDVSEQRLHRFQVDFETRLGERTTLRNKTYLRDLDWRTNGTLFLGTADFGGGPLAFRTLTTLDDRQTFAGNQFELLTRFDTGTVAHHLLVGVEVARQLDDFDFGIAELDPISIDDPQEAPGAPAANPFLVGDETRDVIAPFVTYQVGLGQRVRLLAGARYDAIDTEVDFSVNFQEFGLPGFSREDRELSPMGGVVYEASDRVTLYANAGRSFAPIGARVREAAVLDPEESRQLEVGAKTSWLGGRLEATGALYELERDNIAISDDNGITQQAGDQRSRGFELELAAEPIPRLRTLVVYAYTDAELTRFVEKILTGPDPKNDFIVLDRSGNQPAFVPHHLLSAWVSRSFANGVGLAGGVRWFSDQYIDEDNLYRADGAALVDAALYYDWGECRVKLNLKNLTDEEYETRGFGAQSVIPATGFTAYAGFEYKF